jgi:hypothetical protein
MSSASDDGIDRDAHLLAALRHAPDASLEPPSSVSTRILAQAYASTQGRGGAAARPGGPWRERLQRLFAPRAPWAAAFGTLAVATLVGVLWSGANRRCSRSRHGPPGRAAAPPRPCVDA